jgi:phosphonopyruvate decarboxylase
VIEADHFIHAAIKRGIDFYAGVPCSYLTPFINQVIASPRVQYVGAANEGDAVAISAGAELGGRRAAVMFQNSGLGNAVSPLTSLTHVFKIPVLVITTLRGEPGGAPDAPQHKLMGEITTQLFDAMQIPWEYFPTEDTKVAPALDRAVAHMGSVGRPYAFVMRKGTVKPSPLRADCPTRPVITAKPSVADAICKRHDMLAAIQSSVTSKDVLIATTGYTGRELYGCEDRPNQLYMVGSMGCASSLGLGLALVSPGRRIIVIDGDGAALMRLGAMTSIGYERPPNLIHVLLDNSVHESTGAQPTVSKSVDFCSIAAACGYEKVIRTQKPEVLGTVLREETGKLTFIHIPVIPGIKGELERPSIRPVQVAERLRKFLEERE